MLAVPAAPAARPARRGVSRSERLLLLAALGPPLVIALLLTLDEMPLHSLGLVFLSSLLLVGAALPPALIARTPVSPANFERCREPLGLAAIGILVPVAVFTLLTALT